MSYDFTGWCQNTKRTCHKTLMSYVAGLCPSTLRHIQQDCVEAVRAMPDGAKAGHYTDTALYISDRIHKIRNS